MNTCCKSYSGFETQSKDKTPSGSWPPEVFGDAAVAWYWRLFVNIETVNMEPLKHSQLDLLPFPSSPFFIHGFPLSIFFVALSCHIFSASRHNIELKLFLSSTWVQYHYKLLLHTLCCNWVHAQWNWQGKLNISLPWNQTMGPEKLITFCRQTFKCHNFCSSVASNIWLTLLHSGSAHKPQ